MNKMTTSRKTNTLLQRVMFITLVVTCFLGSAVLSYASGLSTVDYNYINDLIGDRAIGLGGAFTAISDDPAGAYYNPAGLAFSFDNQISLSVNSFKTKSLKFDNAVWGVKPYEQNITSFYPSFFGVVQTLGPIKIAFTIININNEILDQDNYYSAINTEGRQQTFNINYNITDSTMLYGLSGAIFLSDSFTLGLTVSTLYRRAEQIANISETLETATNTIYQLDNRYITDEVWGMHTRLGAQWMPSKSVCIGLSVGKGFIFSFDRQVQIFYQSPYGEKDYSNTTNQRYKSTVSGADYPIDIRLGVAFFPSKRILFSADVIAHLGNKVYLENVHPTINGALGVEYYITKAFPVRMGLFSNFSNNDENGIEMHTDLYGASLSLSWQTRSSSITLGAYYQFGSGTAYIVEGTSSAQTVQYSRLSVSLTGSAKY